MKTCPVCRENYPAEFVHCTNDGALLFEGQDAAGGTAGWPPAPGMGAGYPSQQNLLAARKKSGRKTLLIVAVVALVVLVPVLLIVALIAIPTMGSMKKQANETSAIQTLRVIEQAETMYEAIYPDQGFACSLAALGGDPASGPASPVAAQLLPGGLASGVKSGYVFSIGNCTAVQTKGGERIAGYVVTAVPLTVGKTGRRGFCGDESGSIKADPEGGTNCTESLGP
jgi:type IV pilus assembly protein PilA